MSTGADLTSDGCPSLFEFENLETYTRSEADLLNWSCRLVGGVQEWKAWIQDAWGELLLAPAGIEIVLLQGHSVESQSASRNYNFQQREILIGRETNNDIVLDTMAVAKHHARIFVENGRCFLEDMGSSLGTYQNQVRIEPNQRSLLQAGDQIAIFPYLFSVSFRQLWARQLDVGVHAGVAETMRWQWFQESSTRGRTGFPIYIHPIGATLWLEISRTFLVEFADRLLRPLAIEIPSVTLGPTASGFLEFMVLSLIERANRDLAFPFQFEIGPIGPKPVIAPEAGGVCLACSLSLLANAGALRIFAPYSSLEAMRRAAPEKVRKLDSPPVNWRFPVSLGSVDLSAGELAGLECDDVLLYKPALELLMPHRFDRGWKLVMAEGTPGAASVIEIGNWNRLQIDKYFEREFLNTEESQAAQPHEPNRTPDLSQLPVHVHVILAEKKLTLPEANGLARGTILELDCEKTGVISLAVNGKILGWGRLVDIEGRLGVKILSWGGT